MKGRFDPPRSLVCSASSSPPLPPFSSSHPDPLALINRRRFVQHASDERMNNECPGDAKDDDDNLDLVGPAATWANISWYAKQIVDF